MDPAELADLGDYNLSSFDIGDEEGTSVAVAKPVDPTAVVLEGVVLSSFGLSSDDVVSKRAKTPERGLVEVSREERTLFEMTRNDDSRVSDSLFGDLDLEMELAGLDAVGHLSDPDLHFRKNDEGGDDWNFEGNEGQAAYDDDEEGEEDEDNESLVGRFGGLRSRSVSPSPRQQTTTAATPRNLRVERVVETVTISSDDPPMLSPDSRSRNTTTNKSNNVSSAAPKGKQARKRRKGDGHKRPWEDAMRKRQQEERERAEALARGEDPDAEPQKTAKQVQKEKRAKRKSEKGAIKQAIRDDKAGSYEQAGVVPMPKRKRTSKPKTPSSDTDSSNDLPTVSQLLRSGPSKRRKSDASIVSGDSPPPDEPANEAATPRKKKAPKKQSVKPSPFRDPIVDFIAGGVPLPRPSTQKAPTTPKPESPLQKFLKTPDSKRSGSPSEESSPGSPVILNLDWVSEGFKKRRAEKEAEARKLLAKQNALKKKENSNPNQEVELVVLDEEEGGAEVEGPVGIVKRLDAGYKRVLVLPGGKIPDSVLLFKPKVQRHWIQVDQKMETVLREVDGVVVAVEQEVEEGVKGYWVEIQVDEDGEVIGEKIVKEEIKEEIDAPEPMPLDEDEEGEEAEVKEEPVDEVVAAAGIDEEGELMLPAARVGSPSEEDEDDERDAADSEIAGSPLELSKLLLEIAEFLTQSGEGLSVLNAAELDFWRSLVQASTAARAVIGALFSRKQKPLRLLTLMDQLAPKGISVPASILEAYKLEAIEVGLYSARDKNALEKLLVHLKVPELKALAKGTNIKGAKKKKDYVEMVVALAAKQKNLVKDKDGNVRLSLGRKERSGLVWDEAASVVDTLVCLPSPIFSALHTGVTVFFRPTPFSYFSSLTDPAHSPLKFAHMAVTGVKGFGLPPNRQVHAGPRSANWWREGRAGFDVWAEASKLAGDIGRLVEQKTEEAYHEAVEVLAKLCADWEQEVKRVGEIAMDDWKEAWRRNATERGAVYTELLTLLAALYQSLGDAESQVEVLDRLLSQRAFGHMHRGRWFDDISRVLQKRLKRPEEAYDWIRRALDAEFEGLFHPRTGRERELLRRAALLEIEIDVPLEHAIVDHEQGFFEAPKRIVDSGVDYFGNGEWDGNLGVEEVAINWFTERGGWIGVHAENSIAGLIFNLLAVDLFFPESPKDIPEDAMPHRYGRQPADLYSIPGPLFFENRSNLIQPWIDIVRSKGVELLIERDKVYRERRAMPVGIGSWKRVPHECLAGVAKALGNERLAKLCEAIVETGWRSRSGGFPDLTLWKYDAATDTYHVLFSEVKGPGDQLSESQQIWIQTLLEIGCDAEVSHILAKNDVEGNYC